MRPALVVVAILQLSVASAAAPFTSSFEQWDGEAPIGWAGEGLTHSADARTGESAMRIDLARTDRGNYRGLLYPDGTVPVEPGKLYRLRVWAKGLANVALQLTAVGDDGPDQALSHQVFLEEEWVPLQLYHGVVGETARRMRIVIIVSGGGVDTGGDPSRLHAIFDDMSLEEVGALGEPGANVLPNGGMEGDADGDGVPDGWEYPLPVEPPHERGPDGSRALAGWAGADPHAPKPDLSPERWWDWASYSFEEATWATPAASPAFPVEPGRSYRIAMQSSGRRVNRLLMKLEWRDEAGQPLTDRVDVRTPCRHGTWRWVEDTLDFTAPTARVASARMLWRTRASGGWLWLDNVSVRPLSSAGIGYRVSLPFSTSPIEGAIAPAEPPLETARTQVEPVLEVVRPEHARVVEADGAIAVELTSGVTLHMRGEPESLLGVGAVELGGLPLRNPGAPPIAPLVETASGGAYRGCRYLGNEVADDGTVTLHTALMSEDGREDRLDWILRGTEREIAGQTYRGVGYAWELRCTDDEVLAIIDRATWELGGRAEGVTVITQDAYAVDNVFTIGGDCVYAGAAHYRFAHGDGLDYQCSPAGALAVFHDEVHPRVPTSRRAWLERIAYHDTIAFAGEPTARTPLKCVLYAPEGSHDQWTRVHDYVYDRFAEHWGAARETPLPIIGELMERRERNVETRGRTFHVMADEILPEIAPLGFAIVNCATLSGHLGLGMFSLEPAEELGGMEGLAHLCASARELGMSIQAWGPTARLSQASPIFQGKQHWLLEGPGGQPPTSYSYPTVRACRMRGAWMPYALERYRAIRDATGLDCLWLDSYHNYTLGPSFADPRVALEQAEDLFRYHGELSRMGYRIYTEATGTMGVPSPGFPMAESFSDTPGLPDPMTRYRVSNYIGSEAAREALLDPGYYYRLLANQAPPMLSWLHLREHPEVHQEIARCNRDYVAVVRHMVRRRTLPDGRGVEWTDPAAGTRVLFAYRDFEHSAEDLGAVYDVTGDRDVPVEGGRFATEAMHTYRMARGEG